MGHLLVTKKLLFILLLLVLAAGALFIWYYRQHVNLPIQAPTAVQSTSPSPSPQSLNYSQTPVPMLEFTIPTLNPQLYPKLLAPLENYPGVIGWEADKDGVIAYYDGSFFVRDGKNQRYSFAIFNQPASFKWYNAEGFLPCLVTEFERNGAIVKIMNFGDLVTLSGHDYVAIYSRVAITNFTAAELILPAEPSAGLLPLAENPATVPPNQTILQDFVVATDRFGNTYAWPSDAALAAAGSWDQHYAHMKQYWDGRLSGIVQITQLPDPRLINAYKAGFIYTHIIRDGNNIHVGENGYDAVFDHDSLGILTTLFKLGDFTYAKPLLSSLQAKTQYDDARYKNSWVWALYFSLTDDEAFVRDHFAEIQANTHHIEADLNAAEGILNKTNDIDANGYWMVDDASALFGLTTYQYLAERLGQSGEADWARNLYDRLLASVNQQLAHTMQSNEIAYLPCDITQPNNANRCNNPNDANWASMLLFGRWFWEGFLWGAEQSGPLINSIDATYNYGFDRLKSILPAHTYGGYPGYSTTYNAGYGRSGLRSVLYRTEAILDYQFMLDNTQSSPFGWWEGIEAPRKSAWEGTHPAGGSGSCPHMWGQSFATAALLDSLVVEKSDGSLLIGRGVPNDWVKNGQVIELTNFPITGNKRLGIRIEGLPGNQVRLTLAGDSPQGNVIFNLPVFIENIQSTSSGSVDLAAGEVILPLGNTTVVVTLVTSPR